jgi:hypothetical protein
MKTNETYLVTLDSKFAISTYTGHFMELPTRDELVDAVNAELDAVRGNTAQSERQADLLRLLDVAQNVGSPVLGTAEVHRSATLIGKINVKQVEAALV